MKSFKAKGYMFFAYTPEGLIYDQTTKETIIEEKTQYYSPNDAIIKVIKDQVKEDLSFPIYDLMSGKDFLKNVDCGGFIDYDGTLSEVFVDGFVSNIGLMHKGIMQGDFLLNKEAFEELCENHDVKVNWANK